MYPAWNKPIVVLGNDGNFSNAEIFSDAIDMLRCGELFGVPAGGGVISTGPTAIVEAGF